jgi:Aspartyl protease
VEASPRGVTLAWGKAGRSVIRQRAQYPSEWCVLLALVPLALSACGGSALSPTSLTPQKLLARYRNVNTPLQGPGIYHFRYQSVGNDGEISISDYYGTAARINQRDYRVVVMHQGLRAASGRNFGRLWQQSANGLVLPEANRATIFERTLESATRRSDPRVRVLGITQGDSHRYVLEIRPNSRILQRLYISEATFLLRKKETQDYDGRVQTENVDSYVYVGGTPVASHGRYSDNISHQTIETRLVKFERLSANRYVLARPKSRLPFVAQYPLPASLNTIFGPTGILVRADIGGSPYWLKFDSGSSGILIDRTLIRRLDLKEFWRFTDTKGGRYETSVAVLPRLDIGPLYAKNVFVGVAPYEQREGGVSVVGLLGCDFIASVPLAIDFYRQTIVALSTPPSSRSGWKVVSTPIQGCRPSMDMRLNGQHAELLLDFGAEDTLLNEDVFDKLRGSTTQLDTKVIQYIGLTPLDAVQYVVPRASAGSLDLSPLLVTVVTGGRGQDLDNDGALGRNVLVNYRIVLDYPRQRVFFQRASEGEMSSHDIR